MRTILVAAMMMVLGGCSAPRPIVDLKAVDPVAYQQDHNDCWVLAQRSIDPNIGAMAGPKQAVMSGVGSGLMSAATGGSSSVIAGDVVTGAVGGLIAGPMVQSLLTEYAQSTMIGRCLENRGYEILNVKEMRLTPYNFCMMYCPYQSGFGCGEWAETQCVPLEEARQERLKEQRRARSGQRPAS